MKITELINTFYIITKDICLYILYYVVICFIVIEAIYFLIFLKTRYKQFKIYKIIQNYRNTYNISSQQNVLYKFIEYIPKDKPDCEDKLIQPTNYIFYYLKKSIFFLQNYKYLHLKRILNCIFVRNNIIDIRTIKYLTQSKVIQFKKDVSSCLLEAYNSFNYKNKKELIYIYFKLYSNICFFFQSKNFFFFHFLTNVLIVSWVYAPCSL
ncbi:conserved Plasmodium protein, unknown function [Plasmodium berghei]|uniref:Uncharacterized protein n=2 Tax=Plasmodium berghei TaxID=5821 RepID=A0A509AP67_PLABA|nr:conserved Plasmodium protein, unknown function [Plasmodium berghei ANKA]CXI36448.1 conserved Plasmodium protein, unknown function [Plasmodium berghei]SCM21591.1 conserved Plasmodium protein, unknown function [Plasmodium berghei]SCN24792.1 conserved Plasmodium protein, unknown function [Plasmodium berghei]SCO61268.1 conserved Plasmodium protein, unknown function [Plasmodium berghei]VUC55484.1 conserved Plasmodium protein, unknown function [Plasmodium berghei ANKA]|eukprot:XP_034421297.1 conserved Plasmodium protein, unknown function [Plasmodium berghei ANKA]